MFIKMLFFSQVKSQQVKNKILIRIKKEKLELFMTLTVLYT